jgi:glycosyltransferase involved in cell wall biosynthesis
MRIASKLYIMNILHLIDSGGLYGAENVVLNLMNRQKEIGFKSTLGSIGTKADSQKAIEEKATKVGLPVEIFRMRNGPNVSGAIKIYEYAHKINFDIIHCHGYKANILSGLLPFRYRKIPYIITLHGWTSTNIFSKMWFYEMFDAVMVKRANHVVAVSKAMGENLKLKYLNITPTVIHNGISEIYKYYIENKDYNLNNVFDKKDLKIISIGRLSKEKGFCTLLKSLQYIKTKLNDHVRLFIVGEGPEKFNLIKLSQEYGIRDNVFFPGYIDNACKMLKYFDIFVMSSITEGMPITLLEAMRDGMPIVATSVGGIPEALEGGKCGILVPPGNELELAKSIVQLYENNLLREDLSKNAKIRFQKEFTVEIMEEKYRAVYIDVINKNNRICLNNK